MKSFIYTNVEKYRFKSALTTCCHCKAEITPFPLAVPQLAFQHLHDAHPSLFQTMKAAETPVCPEDIQAW